MACLHDTMQRLPEYPISISNPSPQEIQERLQIYTYNTFGLNIDCTDVFSGDGDDCTVICTGKDLSKFTTVENHVWIDIRLMHVNHLDQYHEFYKKLYCLDIIPCEASIFRILYKRIKMNSEQKGDSYIKNLCSTHSIDLCDNYDVFAQVTQSLLLKGHNSLPAPIQTVAKAQKK
ncbi:MAG: hypothetical protein CMB64_05240 [Euryarchaeota archaeon]|nr:hypothetical protein [Euryarchaeota archaeon]